MRVAQGPTDATGQVIEQVPLQFLGMLRRHRVRRERAVAGGDAVDAPPFVYHASQERVRRLHACRRVVTAHYPVAEDRDAEDAARRHVAADVDVEIRDSPGLRANGADGVRE
jgi:hypothetical protein